MTFLSLLTVDVGCYLPHYETITIYFMKDILAGKKKALKVSEMKYLFVPQYESLSVKRILEFASSFPRVYEYFPIEKEVHSLPR